MVAVGRAAANLGRVGEAERYYQAGLQRLAGDLSAAVSDGKSHEPADHLYALDLDLFGPGSLFARLCVARTSNGQATLARWLLAPAARDVVLRRQQAVTELAGRLELREELWRAAGPVSREVHPDSLAAWLRSPARPVKPVVRIAALALSMVAIPVVYWLSEGQVLPAAALLVVELLFVRPHRKLVSDIGAQAQSRVDELKAVAVLAQIVERERFTSAALQAVQAGAAIRGGAGAPAHRRPGAPGGMVRVAAQPVLRPGLGAVPGGHPAGVRHRALAGPPRRGRRRLAGGAGRAGGAGLAGHLRLRASGPALPGHRPRRGGAAVRRGERVPPAAAGGHPGGQRRPPGSPDAPVAGDRIQHVGQEHAAAHGGRQHGAGAGRGAGAGHPPAAVAPAGGRQPAHGGLAAGGGVPVLRGDQAPARGGGPGRVAAR